MIDTKRASALRDALCQILSATGAYSHEIPSLCQKALERDNAMLDEASSTPRVPLSEEGKVIGSATDRSSLRSFVREGVEIEPPETKNDELTRSVELGEGPAPQHAPSGKAGA
jgi:hypothetical protein